MPKTTFFNLPSERQQEIIDKAENIFLRHSYDISLVRLLEELGLASGTFYRYFADKDDLYLHMMEITSEQRSMPDASIFHPAYEELTDENFDERTRRRNLVFQKAPDEVVRRFYFGKNKDRLINRYRKELQRLKYDGVLRDDADPDLLAFMYATTLYNFEMYCREAGLTGDFDLIWKMKKYFYFSFFKYGILKNDEQGE